MQPVARYTFLGLLALASLTACGDKVQVQGPPAPGTVVHSVTVSPSSISLAVGGTATLAASVDADAGVTNRTVTWSSSDATIASVGTDGKVTAVKAGVATIKATSVADATVSGAAAVTVTGSGSGAIPTVTISSINQTNAAGQSVPANLGNVAGQLDVILNVDTNGGILKTVTATLKCGTDSVVNTQTVANLVPSAAEAAAAPVTLSFNTAAFSSTGVAALHNGTCTISAQATTASGTQSATNSTQLTLNNKDVIIGSLTASNTKNDAAGLAWNGGTITVVATPVFYTAGRTVASTSISFEGRTVALTGAGPQTATFVDNNDPSLNFPTTANDINGITDTNAGGTVAVSTVDSNGNSFANAGNALFTSASVLANANAPVAVGAAPNPFRLDTQKPLAGMLALKANLLQNTSANGYINGNFRFVADSAAGFCGPSSTGFTPGNAGTANPVCTGSNPTANHDSATVPAAAPGTTGGPGVDKVTVIFQTRVTGASSSTYTTRTSSAGLTETSATSGNTNSYQVRMITTDALGNADTTTLTTFGIDITAPSSFASTQIAGPPNQSQYKTIGGSDAGGQQYQTSGITDNLSGPSIDPANGSPRVLVAQTKNSNILNPSNYDVTTFEGKVYGGNVPGAVTPGQAIADLSPCMIGRFNAAQANAGPNALQAFDRAGTLMGYCTPVFFDIGAGNVPPNADFVGGGTSTAGGYYTTEIIAIDQAGNTAAPFVGSLVEEGAAAVITGVDLPGSITGNTSVSIPATATDNVDLVASSASIVYGSGMTLRYPNTAGPGTAFDNVLTRSGTVSPTISNFVRNLQITTGGAPSSTVTPNANSVNVYAFNAAGFQTVFNASLTPVAFNSETSSSFSATTFTGGFAVTANNNPVYNCPAPTSGQTTGCGVGGTVTPTFTSTTLTASASGVAAASGLSFNNPFALVTFSYQNAGGEWVQFGSTSAFTVTDNGTNRIYAYPFTWDPPAVGADGTSLTPAAGGTINLAIRAVGINGSGDAISTQTYTLTITNT